jgi:hypothetical protein
MTLLAMLPSLCTNNLKGLGATLTLQRHHRILVELLEWTMAATVALALVTAQLIVSGDVAIKVDCPLPSG